MHAVAKLLLVASLVAAGTCANAVELTAPTIVNKMRNAYADLSTYRDTTLCIHNYANDSWTNSCSTLMGGRNCYRIDVTTGPHPFVETTTYASDGVHWYHNMLKYSTDPLPNLTSVVQDSRVPALFFNVAWGNIAADLALPVHGNTVRSDDENVNGTPCYVLTRRDDTSNVPRQLTAWIGKDDFLIRKWMDEELAPTQTHRKTVELHGNIVTNETIKREEYTRDLPDHKSRRQASAGKPKN